MGLRDVFLTVLVLGALPFMVWRPAIGVMFWAWLGLMNPHRLAYGFGHDFPFAQLVAIATILGLFFSQAEKHWKSRLEAYLLLALVCWMNLTTLQALEPGPAAWQWGRVMRGQAMNFVALFVLGTRAHVEKMVWILALSIGFYSVKGGVFTILHGGNYLVWGPESSQIEDNNAMAVATIMIMPLLYYLFSRTESRWLRYGFGAAMVLSAFSALGSHSRGALLAIGAMTAFLWLHSRNKILLGVAIVVLAPALITFMPAKWSDRMNTIVNYQSDESAEGRLHAWRMATRVANDRLFGGGFELYSQDTYNRYMPEFPTVHAAHSIYFQMLGEHGWIGLALFLLMWLYVWRNSSWIIAATEGRADLTWANSLASMLRVSLFAYFVGGAFLNICYWDLPYYELVMLVVMRDILGAHPVVPETVPATQRPSVYPQSTATNPSALLRDSRERG